jgi:hypothetical protein
LYDIKDEKPTWENITVGKRNLMKWHDEERHDFEIGVFWTGSCHHQVSRQEPAEAGQHSK